MERHVDEEDTGRSMFLSLKHLGKQRRLIHLSQCFTILFCGWLAQDNEGKTGKLLTIEEVGTILKGA
jgi:hypothetical protein